jgi:Prolyl oligopeptidase family
MQLSRRKFGLGLTGAVLSSSLIPQLGAQAQEGPATRADVVGPPYFFKNPTFEIVFIRSLGRAYYSGGDIGKVLYLASQVEDGDFEGAYLAFRQAGDEARAIAKNSFSRGHKESARQAYLWAQGFYDSATYFLDSSKDPSRFLATWEQLYDCWIQSLPLFDPPIEPVRIPYETTELRGFFIRAPGEAAPRRPLLILANGSDGSLLDMWLQGGAGAVARGFNCLTFDGPGQGYALWKQRIYFRPDWENVIRPVVDYALTRPEVDAKRIAIQGISQGGYWVPRAVAFEKRIAAAIADPGVVDVSSAWLRGLPKPMLGLLKAGRKAEFDAHMTQSLNPASKAALSFRMRPYGFSSYYDVFKAVLEYQSPPDIVGRITCPMLITDPANEVYWPGQSRRLYDLLTSPKTLVEFPESSGADLHCEPKGAGLRDLHVFDWLDKTLGR